MTDERFKVENRPDEFRYVLLDRGDDGSGSAVIGEEGYVDVEVDGRTERVLFHTEVAKEYGGQGLASVLVSAVVQDVIATGARIVLVCPYVVSWVKKHPEVAAHVVEARPEHLRAVRDQQG